ncbi:MAG: hypothetical protein KJO64_06040, partial [Bacteroidia bacterium]|nr:hypothetical protein [Bacteroidia bacterium]
IYAAGVACLLIFVLVRLTNVPASLVVDLDNTGDLYRQNYIDLFKEELPAKSIAFNQSPKHASIDDAEILIFGDSFFNFRRHKSVPEYVADSLNKKVFFHKDYSVKDVLAGANFDGDNKKLLIFELAERGITIKFGPDIVESKKFEFDLFTQLDTTFFSEKYNKRYRYLLERSKLSHNVYSSLNTFNFNAFKSISSFTPVYTKEPACLFYGKTVNNKPGSYNFNYSPALINFYSDNILDWKNEIEQKYNVEVLFYFIPNKSSVYHEKISNEGYNNFLPRLSTALNARGVKHISMYEEFEAAEEILYYPTDTHWNDAGTKMGAEKLIKYLRTNN